MAFKMKGSPIHRGDIQGTAGHSALKAKWVYDYIIKPVVKNKKVVGKTLEDAWLTTRDAVSAAWRTPAVTSSSKNINKKVIIETATTPKNIAKAGSVAAAGTYVGETGIDTAKQNVDDSKIEKTAKAAEITKKIKNKKNWDTSSKLFDNAIKNDSTLLDYISPDATGKTDYDKLANTIKLYKKEGKEFSTEQDLLNKYFVDNN